MTTAGQTVPKPQGHTFLSLLANLLLLVTGFAWEVLLADTIGVFAMLREPKSEPEPVVHKQAFQPHRQVCMNVGHSTEILRTVPPRCGTPTPLVGANAVISGDPFILTLL